MLPLKHCESYDMATQEELMAAMAALNHQVTDEDGKVISAEDTVESDSATEEPQYEEEISMDEVVQAEKPADNFDEETQALEEEVETQPTTDEVGKRTVPVERFNEVYGKAKTVERENEALKAQLAQVNTPDRPDLSGVDKATQLEVEMLYERHPEFDPTSPKYSPLLDEMGGEILLANKGISRLEAARRAKARAAALSQQTDAVKGEARIVKQQMSDSGMASRASRSVEQPVDLEKMTDQQLEAHLKSLGAW